MTPNFLQIHADLQEAPANAEAVSLMEKAISDYPYFGMAYTLLAKHESASGNGKAALLKAAAYTRNRALLKSFILGEQTIPQAIVSVEKAVEEVPVEKEEKTEEVVSESKAETQGEPESTANQAIEAPQQEEPTQETEAAETVAQIQEEETAQAETNTSETEKVKIPAAPVSKIDWGLDTRIRIRLRQTNSLSEKIRGEIDEFSAKIAEKEGEAAPLKPETTDDKTANPEEVVSQPIPTDEVEISLKEDSGKKAEKIKETTDEETPLPILETAEIDADRQTGNEETILIQEEEFSGDENNPEEKPETQPEAEPAFPAFEISLNEEQNGETQSDPEKAEVEYQIGSFSNFSFAPDMEVEEEEPEVQVQEENGGPADTELNGIIVEEDARILQITVTPDQLSKYFNGKMPESIPLERKADETEEVETETEETESENNFEKKPKGRVDDDSVQNIIQQFIDNEPSVSQPTPGKKSQNLAATSALEDEDLVTETLARIHAAQGNISKAIKIYDKLALLFPEKKSYFANQISKLKK